MISFDLLSFAYISFLNANFILKVCEVGYREVEWNFDSF